MMTKFQKAINAFIDHLRSRDCDHSSVNQASSFCPECGYRVKVIWAFVRCHACNAKRMPQKPVDHKIKPLQKFCRHCGSADFHVVKKDHIDAYELLYCVSIKEIDYTIERQSKAHQQQGNKLRNTATAQVRLNPSKIPVATVSGSLNILEGETAHITNQAKSAWKQAPFFWQPNRQATANQSPHPRPSG